MKWGDDILNKFSQSTWWGDWLSNKESNGGGGGGGGSYLPELNNFLQMFLV